MQNHKITLKHQPKDLLKHLLVLSEEFNVFCHLNSNNFTHDKYSKHDWIIALGEVDNIAYNVGSRYSDISAFLSNNIHEWKFTYIAYDLKNQFENLHSNNIDYLDFYDMYIFVPKYIIKSKNNKVELIINSKVSKAESDNFINKINSKYNLASNSNNPKLTFNHRISKAEYLKNISNIRNDIKYGNIYEMNFCQEFYIENTEIKPLEVYNKLNKYSPSPFSAYFRENERFIMSASPERYIHKSNNRLISQPIKGTAKRSHSEQDNIMKQTLQNSIKERAENIMIVDLVRNDLSRINNSKNIKVEELCRIYSFPHVHQMISTISAEIEEDSDFVNILESSFPMGSMTGAPKIKAMELIEKYESTKRGVFSGSVGYIDDKGDFDFSVIIRSLLYNSTNKYLSLSTGGAITYLSDAEKEYEESLLKAQAIFDVFK